MLASEQDGRVVLVQRRECHIGGVPESHGTILVSSEQELAWFRFIRIGGLLAEQHTTVDGPGLVRVQVLGLRFTCRFDGIPEVLRYVRHVLRAGHLCATTKVYLVLGSNVDVRKRVIYRYNLRR